MKFMELVDWRRY